MRRFAQDGPLSCQAISGTNVVLLALDLDRDRSADVLGFSVERLDHTEGRQSWLNNDLRFDAVKDSPSLKDKWGTNYNPLQTFLWGDYTAKPNNTYTYLVHAVTGTPGQELTPKHSVRVQVHMEQPKDKGVWFNRGVISSQAYAHRFGTKKPGDVPRDEAWIWLSRGLEEALLAFIGRAVDNGWELHGAFYEFTLNRILKAFAVARQADARIQLVVDKDKAGKNEKAAAAAGISDLVTTWRETTGIPHNKFLIASDNGVPIAVWTGSTNISENGVFGHSNVGHYEIDRTIAQAYRDYWDQLTLNELAGVLNNWVEDHNKLPIDGQDWPTGTSVVFSPRGSLKSLDRYAAKFDGAQVLACATFPFDLYKGFAEALPGMHDALRYLLFESKSDAAKASVGVTDPKTTIVSGAKLPDDPDRGWLKEITNPLANAVYFVHTKYLLIDPLGDDPMVITGSANFSASSTEKNDENMLIIRGDRAVAEIYLTEFMRLFNHYKFRYYLNLPADAPMPGSLTSVDAHIPLTSDGSWLPKYFDEPGRARQREVLGGRRP